MVSVWVKIVKAKNIKNSVFSEIFQVRGSILSFSWPFFSASSIGIVDGMHKSFNLYFSNNRVNYYHLPFIL